jgi:hypothetical protein
VEDEQGAQLGGKHFIASISLPALNTLSLHCLNFLQELMFFCFIASHICLHCLTALTLTTKNMDA